MFRFSAAPACATISCTQETPAMARAKNPKKDEDEGIKPITRNKRARLRRLASQWLVAHGVLFDEVRIDAIGLVRTPAGEFQIEHVRGVG